MSHLNPYNLLGVTTESSISELKKNYYNLALICHPDRGGNKDDMQQLYSCYKYILEQLSGVRNDSYEDAEEELKSFYQQQKEEELPTFYTIHVECQEWLQKFNQEFEKLKLDESNPFDNGYGKLMDQSEPNEDYNDVESSPPKNMFVTDVIEYKEPNCSNNFITKQPLNTNKIKDFSCLDGNMNMNDYKNAYCNHPDIQVDKTIYSGNVIEKYEKELQNRKKIQYT
jgi:hypothetical protein